MLTLAFQLVNCIKSPGFCAAHGELLSQLARGALADLPGGSELACVLGSCGEARPPALSCCGVVFLGLCSLVYVCTGRGQGCVTSQFPRDSSRATGAARRSPV